MSEKINFFGLLRKAQQLAGIASDWNLDEVEIDGEMVHTYQLKREFRQAQAVIPRPNWADAPKTAKWWCVDPNGVAHFSKNEPKTDGLVWDGDFLYSSSYAVNIPLGVDWRLLVSKRPTGEETNEWISFGGAVVPE